MRNYLLKDTDSLTLTGKQLREWRKKIIQNHSRGENLSKKKTFLCSPDKTLYRESWFWWIIILFCLTVFVINGDLLGVILISYLLLIMVGFYNYLGPKRYAKAKGDEK